MNQFLIPANTKRSMLILGLFNPIDLIIFGTGILLTVVILLIVGSPATVSDVFIILIPVLVTGAMVTPVPNHHNIWQLTANIYGYFSGRRTYYWRGWCMLNGEQDKQGSK